MDELERRIGELEARVNELEANTKQNTGIFRYWRDGKDFSNSSKAEYVLEQLMGPLAALTILLLILGLVFMVARLKKKGKAAGLLSCLCMIGAAAAAYFWKTCWFDCVLPDCSDTVFLLSWAAVAFIVLLSIVVIILCLNSQKPKQEKSAADAAGTVKERKIHYFDQALIHRTIDGQMVRSKSEVVIANMLYYNDIEYKYEKTLTLGPKKYFIPDFTIEDPEKGTTFYWEHCGMMNDAAYCARWKEKQDQYKEAGIVEGKNLIVSYDGDKGSIDSQKIQELIDKYLSK